MSEKLYKVKPLEWEGIKNLYFCTSDIAEYQIRKRADGGWLCMARGRWDQYADSLEAGKLACEAHWRERLAAVLEEVVVSKCWECGRFGHCTACGDVGVKVERKALNE